MFYSLLKFVHVLGAIVILGTGAGIAFFMLMAHLSRDIAYIARTATTVVLADFVFTATAVIVQPVTGYLLLRQAAIPVTEGWVLASLVLYSIAASVWLPVVWIQIRMRDLATMALANAQPLPAGYYRLFRLWFALGFPGFGSVMLILWLMTTKASL